LECYDQRDENPRAPYRRHADPLCRGADRPFDAASPHGRHWRETLYPASGLFLASDTLETLPDVFGSAYLVALNLSTPARRAAVGGFLAAQWRASGGSPATTVFQEGQVRHLPQPLLWKKCWEGCPSAGTYQNGAFWATPLNWVLPALELTGHGAEAQGVAEATLASFRAGGVMECINRDKDYAGVRDYVASAANVLGVVEVAA